MNFQKTEPILLLLFLPFLMPAQSKVYTFIQPEKQIRKELSIQINSVIDARTQQSDIGMIYSSDRRKKYPAAFKHPLSDEFLKFYKGPYPKEAGAANLHLLVEDFRIDHLLSESGKDKGKVTLNADFYIGKGDSCYFVCHYQDSLFEESDDVRMSHPNRIRRILLRASLTAEKALLGEMPSGSEFKKETLSCDQLRKKSLNPERGLDRKQENGNILPDYYFFNTGAFYSFSRDVMLFGVSGSLVLQLKKSPKVLIGANLDLMIYGMPTEQNPGSSNSYSVRNINPGLKLLKQVRNNFFLNFNPQLVLGTVEKLNAPSKSESLSGLEIDFGAYLIPPDERGIYSGINFFFKSTNSTLYGEGFGLKLDFGYRF